MVVNGPVQMLDSQGWAKLFPLREHGWADSYTARILEERWPVVARNLGFAFVVTPAVASVVTLVAVLIAPGPLMVVLLPAHLAVLVAVFGGLYWWVRGLLWPPKWWRRTTCALLIPVVLQIVEISGAARYGHSQWVPFWPCLVWLVATVVAAMFAWTANQHVYDVRIIYLAEYGDDVLLCRQVLGHERGMDSDNPKWGAIVNVDVLLRGGDLVVHAKATGGHGSSRRVVERTFFRIDLAYVTQVAEQRFPSGRTEFRWFTLPNGRPLQAAATGAVVVSTVLPGMGLTVPTGQPELIGEAVRRRIRRSGGPAGRAGERR